MSKERKILKIKNAKILDLEKIKKITDLESYKKSKGLVDIEDPYMGAPLTVYEHTLPHNKSSQRKLLFKYPHDIRGKQWDAADIYQKQLGFNKWMEPLGISAFATALATSTAVPPMVIPVSAVGAVMASGQSDKLKPILDKAGKKIKEEKGKGLKKINKKRKKKIKKKKKKRCGRPFLKPVRYLLNVPPYIGLDIMVLDGIY